MNYKFAVYYFFTTQILGAVAADLLYKSMPGLCLIISRAARYLPKPALNNIPSLLCILRSLCTYLGIHFTVAKQEIYFGSSLRLIFLKEVIFSLTKTLFHSHINHDNKKQKHNIIILSFDRPRTSTCRPSSTRAPTTVTKMI